MDDEFLCQFRLRPNPAGADALYQHLSGSETSFQQHSKIRRKILPTLALCAGLILLWLLAPTVRSTFADFIRTIGGMTFREAKWTPVPPGSLTHVPFEYVSLADAKSRLPFAWGIPVWAPEGYSLGDAVALADFSVLVPPPEETAFAVHLTWQHAGGEPAITLSVIHPAPLEYRVPAKAISETTINEQQAALIRGGTDPEGQWIDSSLLTLMWQDQAGVQYSLVSSEEAVAAEDLLRMAESIP